MSKVKKAFRPNLKERHPLRSAKAFFFDASGVLYRREVTKLSSLRSFLINRFSLQEFRLSEYECQNKLVSHKLQNSNKLDMADYHRELVKLHDITDPSSVEEAVSYLENVIEQTVVNDTIPYTLNTLKDRGFKIAIVTNSLSNSTQKRQWLEDIGISVNWDLITTSIDAQTVLPNSQTLLRCSEKLGILANESIFVGHSKHELEAAKSSGFITCAIHRDDEFTNADHDLGDELANILYLT